MYASNWKKPPKVLKRKENINIIGDKFAVGISIINNFIL